jgi:hypothetical protein
MYVYINVYVYVCIHVSIRTYIYIYINKYIYIHILLYTSEKPIYKKKDINTTALTTIPGTIEL